MKNRKTIILSSAAIIALCGSLIVGATYALFTSESETNIAINSGNIDVFAKVDASSVQTKQLGQEYAMGDNHTLGGGVTLSSDGSLSLDRLMPGDGVKFNITIQNNSNVPVKYRTVVSKKEDTGLFSGLTITLGEETYNGEDGEFSWKINSTWQRISPVTGENKTVVTVPVAVEFIDTASASAFQNTSCGILYRVEAVQGNADTIDEPSVMYIANVEDFHSFAARVRAGKNYAGKTVHLGADIDLNGETLLPLEGFAGTFDGDNKTISNFSMSGQYVGLFGNLSSSVEVKDLTIRDASFTGTGSGSAGAALFADVPASVHVKSENIHLENVTIENVERGGGIVGNAEGELMLRDTSFSGLNVTATTYAGGVLGYYGGQKGEIREIKADAAHPSMVTKTSSDGGCASIAGYQKNGFTLTAKFDTNEIMYWDEAKRALVYKIDTTNQTNGYIGSFTQSNIYGSRGGEGFYYTNDRGVIDSENGFKAFRDSVNKAENEVGYYLSTVQLECDIDLKNEPFTPVYGFTGKFDGMSHTISNLKIESTDEIDQEGKYGKGLFATGGMTTTNRGNTYYHFAQVSNLTVINASVSGKDNVGVLFGASDFQVKGSRSNYDTYAYCAFDNVTLSGLIQVNGKNNVGAIAGNVDAHKYYSISISNLHSDIFKNCTVNAESGSFVKGANYVGGIVGYTGEATVDALSMSSCSTNINVTGENYVGGIAGHFKKNFTMADCSVKNAVITATSGSDASETIGTGEGTVTNAVSTGCTVNKQ